MEDSILYKFLAANEEESAKIITDFNKKNTTVFTFAQINIKEKKKLVDGLFNHLDDKDCPNHVLFLETIRILSRDKEGLEQLFTSTQISSLVSLAGLKSREEELIKAPFHSSQTPVIVEAQKCLCNLIFNSSSIQRMCSCNSSCIEGIMLRLLLYKDAGFPYEIKYFDMRMLFLLTAFCADIRPKLRNELHGLTYLMEVLDLILKSNLEQHRTRGKKRFSRNSLKKEKHSHVMVPCLLDGEVDLACEVLKVLFNLTVNMEKLALEEHEEAHFLRLVSILHEILLCNTKNVEKKYLLHSHTVDLLTVMPPASFEELLTPLTDLPDDIEEVEYEFEGMNIEALIVLIEFLDYKLSINDDQDIKENLSPVLSALSEGARCNRFIRKFLKIKILPPLKDVMKKPEDGRTIRNKLVKLLTSADVNIKELVADLLFVLCKEKVSRLIKYTGYGNAAGLLANRGLMLGGSTGNYSSESEDTDTEEYLKYKDGINPVVGCYQEPRPDPLEGMTDEQKEYEAMQLVQLLNKMTGPGSCVTPMRIGADGKPHPIEHVLELQKK